MALPALVDQVHSHLREVREDPSKALDQTLLEHVDRQVTELIQESWRNTLLDQLSDLLPILQQDPTPALNLIIVLVSPTKYDFTHVLAIQPPVDFVAGFSSSIPSINLAVLTLLEKATYRKSDIDIVAGKANVVASLIKLWLCTPDTAVAGRAHDVIERLLLGDEGQDTMSDSGIMGEGLMWRRIFRDRDIYGSIFSICSLKTAGLEGPLSRREKTIAQARLLDMLLKIDSIPVRTSQIPDIEQQYGVDDGGLLHLAAIHMVDYRDDVLMHMTLLQFYANYLRTGKNFALLFLRSYELHARSIAHYLEPGEQESLAVTYLYGWSAKYVSAYCSTFPEDLLLTPTASRILWRVTQAVENTSSSQWAQGKIPKHDLDVLASLPRIMLLPGRQAISPLFSIPVKPANPDALAALARIFHSSQKSSYKERAAARALYYLEMEHVPDFWDCVVATADTVALKESALSALSLIGAVITASWSRLPETKPLWPGVYELPSESELASKCHAEKLPQSGIEVMITQPALGVVIPYLMRPAQSFGSLVGGGRGDVESAVYKIAAAKHDVLIQLHHRLKEWLEPCPPVSCDLAREMMSVVGRRVAQGPMGGTSGVGGQVGTLEL